MNYFVPGYRKKVAQFFFSYTKNVFAIKVKIYLRNHEDRFEKDGIGERTLA